jgi:hypothetical protein
VNNLHDVVLVLVTELKNNSILLRLVHEEVLNLPVLLEKTLDDGKLTVLLALRVHVDDLSKGSEGGLEQVGIGRSDVVLEEPVESLAKGLGRELGVSGLGAVDDLSELSIELLGHASVEGRELSVPLAVGQLRVSENLNELLEGRQHNDRVVVAEKDVVEDVVEDGEALSRLGTNDNRLAVGRELVNESLSLLHASRVIQGKDTKDVTSLESGSRLLDELDNTILLSNEGHVHLHDLDLSIGLTSSDVGTVLDSVLDELTRARRAKLGRVVLLLQQAGLVVDGQTGSTNFLLPVDVVASSIEQDKETTVAQSTDTNRALGAVDEEMVAVRAGTGGGELVSETLVDEVDGEDRLQDILGGNLTLLEASAILGHAGLTGNVSLGDGTADNGEHGLRSLSGKTLGDELIQPTSGDGVLLEGLGLEKLDKVLNGGSEITTNAQLLEGHDHVLPRSRTVLAISENVTELRVRETVNTTLRTDGEVTPDVGATPEVELVHDTVGRLETLTGILRGDSASGSVALWLGSSLAQSSAFVLELEVNLARRLGVDAVQESNIADAVKGKTHSNLQLSSRQIDTTDHLSGRMLDLETGVELQEVELVVGVRVEVLDGTGGDITDELTETDSGRLHGLERVGLRNGDGSLLNNLLVTSLNGAISAEEGDVVAVLISEQLDFEMSGVAGKLHDEDGRARNFTGGGLVESLETVLTCSLSDTLTTTTLGSLDHDGEANLLGLLQTLLPRGHTSLGVDVVGNGDNALVVDSDVADTSSRPGNARHFGVLCYDCGGDLVA